jgi:L-threonate 2-dehydrogenase
VVGSGAGTSRVFELRAPMMAARTYLPATARGTMFGKDVAVIGDFAAGLHCPTPLFDLSASLHTATLATGRGAEDVAAVCEIYAQLAGLDHTGRP